MNPLFGSGSKQPAQSWPVAVLTPEYLFSGNVEPPAQEWGRYYFSQYGRLADDLAITVTDVRPTGSRAAPQIVGRQASFAYGGGIVALISLGEATDALWDDGALPKEIAAELLAGPYSITGSVLSADGTMSPLTNDRMQVRNASFTRIDGGGDGKPILADRAFVATGLVEAAIT